MAANRGADYTSVKQPRPKPCTGGGGGYRTQPRPPRHIRYQRASTADKNNSTCALPRSVHKRNPLVSLSSPKAQHHRGEPAATRTHMCLSFPMAVQEYPSTSYCKVYQGRDSAHLKSAQRETANDVNAGSCSLLMPYSRQRGPGEAGCVQYLYNVTGSLSSPRAL